MVISLIVARLCVGIAKIRSNFILTSARLIFISSPLLLIFMRYNWNLFAFFATLQLYINFITTNFISSISLATRVNYWNLLRNNSNNSKYKTTQYGKLYVLLYNIIYLINWSKCVSISLRTAYNEKKFSRSIYELICTKRSLRQKYFYPHISYLDTGNLTILIIPKSAEIRAWFVRK